MLLSLLLVEAKGTLNNDHLIAIHMMLPPTAFTDLGFINVSGQLQKGMERPIGRVRYQVRQSSQICIRCCCTPCWGSITC